MATSTSSRTTKTPEERSSWMQRVHAVQMKRTPEAWEAARLRIEASRQHEVSYRKCKAVKSHTVRSRALATEGLRQMALTSAPDEYQAVQSRWEAAQAVSRSKQVHSMQRADAALSTDVGAVADLMEDADSEEEQAMMEVADIVGAADAGVMAAVGAEGLTEGEAAPGAGGASGKSAGRGSRGGSGSSSVATLLTQLRNEPTDESECAAKFMLYEGYAAEVEQIRTTLLKFHEESRPTVPATVASGMDAEVKGIDSTDAMGIPDDAREWFVYHMMMKAERNNLKMARILDGFEKRLEFLASNDQLECPVCMESFTDAGDHVAETLGCCHKVCKECWDNWTAVCHGRPYCPLCRHDEFLGAVASHASDAA